ncbi:Uma2 family endonuclease [Actinoplanes missouriensis]|uniref:Uma2 family endonuclease n=1 Tax=Actinoplanes missouriensis TaxID=1866 RepID=UPI0033FF96A8
MSDALLDHSGPWTEDDYLALDRSNSRVELIDGSLLVTPSANGPHQRISRQLDHIIGPSAHEAGREILATLNVRLGPNRILIPDLAVGTYPEIFTYAEASMVLLVCEITSPGNAVQDRSAKLHYYAAAKIPWYLLVEPDLTTYKSITLRLLRLDGDEYREHVTAEHGETLTSSEPFPFSISTEELLEW